MDEEIKNKVREIQRRYCGESVETKLYYAIKETIKEMSENYLTKPLEKLWDNPIDDKAWNNTQFD